MFLFRKHHIEKMKHYPFEKVIGQIFNFFAAAMFLLLFHYCLELTGRNTSLLDEHIYFSRGSILLHLVEFFCAVIALHFFGKLSGFFQSKKRRNILLTVCCVLSTAISIYWVCNSGSAPQGDQSIIVGFADEFNNGNFYGIQRGGYLAMYPHLLGLVTFLRVLFRVFGAGNYYAFQFFQALLVPVIVFTGCMITRELSEDDVKTELYYLLFAMTCFPMYAYTTFVYGDMVSIPFALLAIWAFLSCIKRFKVWKLVGLGLSIGVGVILRTNILIVVIAMLIVVIVKWIAGRNWRMFAIGGAIVAGVLVFHLALEGIYASEKGKDADAIPALCYIAMGLNDDNSYAGWYNIYELGLFVTSDYDVDTANERAMETLKMYAGIYRADPAYMIDFFVRKINSQWNAPMYQGVVMNNNVEGEQSALIANIFNGGKAAKILEKYMKIYQLVVYGSILFLLIRKRKRWEHIEKYVLLIAVFGGFLFSLMWEAKTRYVFPYLIMELPYIALGIKELVDWLHGKIAERRGEQNE